MQGISALCYLEWRQLVNRVRSTVHQPGRVLVYLFAAAYFIFAGIVRSKNHAGSAIPHTIPEPYASALMFAFLALLGIVCYGAASGILGAFSSAADARFLTGSLIPPRIVVTWLQLRRCGASMLRMLFSIFLYAFVFTSAGSSKGITLSLIGGTFAVTAAAVPFLKLQSLTGQRFAQSIAGVVATAGIVPLILCVSKVIPHSIAGNALNSLFGGEPRALLALYLFAAAMVVLAYACANGLYPDLYASSMRMIAFHERQRRGGGAGFSMQHTFERRQDPAGRFIFARLRGAWTIAWKEWIAFVRAPSMQRLFALGLLASAACGAVFGSVSVHSTDAVAQTLSFAAGAGSVLVILIAMSSAIGLGNDLRKPLWWMGRDPLWLRLLAWIAGTSWRFASCLAVCVIAWAVAMRAPVFAIAGVPAGIAIAMYLGAVGLALYSLFPASIDQRGPLAILRAFLTYFLALPPAVAAIVAGFILHSAGAGIAAGILTSFAETLILIAFASWRIAGRGVAFAQAEGA